jgi:uncharacterized protein
MLKKFGQFKNDIAEMLKSKLSAELTYHGFHHTFEVSKNADDIAVHENITPDEKILLQTAVWLHDAGFIHTYFNHEEKGCEMARELLPNYDYRPYEIDLVCCLIEATKIPQKPKTLLEKLIADSDLLYLGTDAYTQIANELFFELKHFTGLREEAEWRKIQIAFLENHQFHTRYCQNTFESIKQQNLLKLKNIQNL